MSRDLEVAASTAHILAMIDEVEERLEVIRQWADELLAREEAKRADKQP